MDKASRIGQLLKREREQLGYTLQEVSQKVGFQHYQTLINIEQDKRELKAHELIKLANLYKRPLNYFTTNFASISEPRVVWRNPAQLRDRKKLERTFLTYCRNFQRVLEITNEKDDILERFLLEIPNKKQLNERPFNYIEEISDTCRKLLNLGGKPAYSLSNVLEHTLGIKVFSLDLGYGGSAASTVGDFGYAILINSSDAPWRRNYDLAHELFHLLTWKLFINDIPQEEGQYKPKIEQWADAFASSLLLPADELRKEFLKRVKDSSIEYIDLVEISREFGVPIEALLWRLVNLQLLKRRDVLDALEKGTLKDIDRKMRVKDWIGEKPYLSERYISLAIKALQMGNLSKAKFAEYVDKSISEVSSFLKKYGYDENEDYSIAFSTT